MHIFWKAITRQLEPDSGNSQLGMLGVIVGAHNARGQPCGVAFKQAVQTNLSR